MSRVGVFHDAAPFALKLVEYRRGLFGIASLEVAEHDVPVRKSGKRLSVVRSQFA